MLAVWLVLAGGHRDCLCTVLPDPHGHRCSPHDHLDHCHDQPCEAHCGETCCQALVRPVAAAADVLAALPEPPALALPTVATPLTAPAATGWRHRAGGRQRLRAPPHPTTPDC
ncbi:MAG: hypothetical protein IT204_06990 [Fimbriimonadaceae bacterium]|nr:hypothetical protein [Fimbriimonadaceae bacterium]